MTENTPEYNKAFDEAREHVRHTAYEMELSTKMADMALSLALEAEKLIVEKGYLPWEWPSVRYCAEILLNEVRIALEYAKEDGEPE